MEAVFSYQAISPATIYMSTFLILFVVMGLSVGCAIYFRRRYKHKWAPPVFVTWGLIVPRVALARTGNFRDFCSFGIHENRLVLSYPWPPQNVELKFDDVSAVRIVDHRMKVLTSSGDLHQSGVIFIRAQPEVSSALKGHVPSFVE